jgi:hypothetical protein
LILPPTHPAIAQHPLFRALPRNKYTKEYLASVEALGGVRQWTGEPKKLKVSPLLTKSSPYVCLSALYRRIARPWSQRTDSCYQGDAQNSTLIKCIAEDALAWVHAPLLSALPQALDEDEDEGEDEDEASFVPQTNSSSRIPASQPDHTGIETPISNIHGGGHDFPTAKLTGYQQEDMSNHGQYQARRPDLILQMEEEEERRKLRPNSTSVSIPAWAERLLQPQEGNHGRYAPAPAQGILGVEQDSNAQAAKVKMLNEDEIQLDDVDEEIEPRRHGVVLPVASYGLIHDHDDQPLDIQPSGLQRLTDIALMTCGPGDLHLASLVDLQSTCDASTKRELLIGRVTSRN